MQDYPIENVIDAPYRFDGFNQEAVDALLGQLVSARSNVWFISQEEPTDRELQFYVAPHSVEEWVPRDATQRLRSLIALVCPCRVRMRFYQSVLT